jgi:MFS family permease
MIARPALGLLRDHDFRGLFLSTTVSQFGRELTVLALPLVAVLALDASEFEVGLLAAMASAAFLLIGLPAGAWVDRMRRRSVLVVGDLARAAILVSVPIAWWTGALTIWQLYAVALGIGVFTVFFDVAYQSYLPHLVGRDNLIEGNAKLETVRSTAQLGGPALAGQLIAWLTAPVALLVDAIAMGASALFVALIRKREYKPAPAPGSKLGAEIREGLRFVLGNRLLRDIVICTSWFNLCASAYFAMMIVFLSREIGLSPALIGLFASMAGIGGLVGAFLARPLAERIGQGRILWVATLVTTPGMLLLPAAQPGWTVWLGAAGMIVMGVGIVVYNVTQVSFRQGLTPDRLLGRMNATVRFIVWGTQPLGALLGGILGQAYGSRTALWVGGLACCLGFLPVLLSPLRNLRELPQTAADEESPPATVGV